MDFDPLLDGRGLEACSCLIKPFSKAELIEHVENLRTRAKQANSSTPGNMTDRRQGARTSGPERRRGDRIATVKSAEVIGGNDRLACVILNLTEGVVSMRLPGERLPCTSTFGLNLEFGTMHACRVCWSVGDKIGVRFVKSDDRL